MLSGTYVGSEHPELVGRTAVLRFHPCGLLKSRDVLAQFDDLHLGWKWTHAWWDFDSLDFVLRSAPHDGSAAEEAFIRMSCRGALARRVQWRYRPWLSARLRETLVGRVLGAS